MQYAVSIPPFTDASTVVEMAVEAEEAGWDGVFLWDHLQWVERVGATVHDPWVLLGAIAKSTQRVRIGTLVTPLSRRRVQVIAKHLLTLDHLSGGRVTFGVGLGEPPQEDFAAFGDEDTPRARARILDESLDVLDRLLRGDRVDHDGKHLTVHAQLRPGPVQLPRPPVWVAGVVPHPAPLRRARRWDGFVPIGPDDLVSPDAVAGYLGEPESDWDVVCTSAPGCTEQEYAEIGATWLVSSAMPAEADWVEELRDRIGAGPRP